MEVIDCVILSSYVVEWRMWSEYAIEIKVEGLVVKRSIQGDRFEEFFNVFGVEIDAPNFGNVSARCQYQDQDTSTLCAVGHATEEKWFYF